MSTNNETHATPSAPNISCKSVVGGWQTCFDDGKLVGPVYRELPDLWNWQEQHADELSTRDPIGSPRESFTIEITRGGDGLRVQLVGRVPGHSTYIHTDSDGVDRAEVLRLVGDILDVSKNLTNF